MAARDDAYGAASGGGHSSCPEGIPVELALLSILAAFGVAFGVLYMALTVVTGGRKKRSVTGEEADEAGDEEGGVGMAFQFADLFWFGKSLAAKRRNAMTSSEFYGGRDGRAHHIMAEGIKSSAVTLSDFCRRFKICLQYMHRQFS